MKDKFDFTHQFTTEDVKVHSKAISYQGFFQIKECTLSHALFAGGESNVMVRELFERGDAVAVLPYDPINNKIVVIEQFRIGAMRTKSSPWLLEVVAGMIDKGESSEQVAIRETKEETGLSINRILPMLNYLSSPGGMSERIYLYLAIVDSSDAGGIYGLANENEDIKVHVFDYNEALDLMHQGQLDNAATLIAMQWLALNKSSIDREYK